MRWTRGGGETLRTCVAGRVGDGESLSGIGGSLSCCRLWLPA